MAAPAFAAKYDDRLGDHPGSGAARPALGLDIRIGIVSPHIVIYRHSADDDTRDGAAHCAWPSPDHRRVASQDALTGSQRRWKAVEKYIAIRI